MGWNMSPSHQRSIGGVIAVTAAILCGDATTTAQTIGTFRWQLRPYCNVLTLTVTQQGSVYTLVGFDDQCGASTRAAVTGAAFLNPDGTIGLGLAVTTTPGATPLHVDATVALATVSGSWRDSGGNSGAFVFTPGAPVPGAPRPVPPGGIPPAAITAAQLAPGAINSAAAAFGVCPIGQYMRGIVASGQVLCEPFGTPPLTTPVDPLPNAGRFPSIAIGADGLPIISSQDASVAAWALRMTHCDNSSCTASTSTTVDSPAGVSVGAGGVAIGVDGLPIVAHVQLPNSLRVTYCSNRACTAAISTTVDNQGLGRAIAIGADGLAVIAGVDTTQTALRVTHCSNIPCTAATSITIDDPADAVGGYAAIAMGADGLPIISHWNMTTNALRITHCSNAACTAAVSTDVDDPADEVGVYSSLKIGIDGRAIISHLNLTARALRVTHCDNIACSTAISTNVDDPVNQVGSYTSLSIGSDGLPVISHNDYTALAVRVTRCANVACTAATSTNVATAFAAEVPIAVTPDGLPVIAYQDQYARALRVTKCTSRTCQ
jgi:hypothetical protein